MTDLRDQLQASLGTAYTIERELGGGGMSRVFLATDNALGRQVVVKTLPPEMLHDLSRDRFRREISLAAGLQHPHIVPLLAAGDANGVPWFSMPFVEGHSLREQLAKGTLAIDAVVRILRDVALALAHAHARGIVHRDIKPDNVLISGGSAMVTDFGIARALEQSGAGGTLTQTGMSVGTPAYMAPEQAAADPGTDHRADIYAFGILGYELLAGHAPFAGRSAQATLAAQMSQTPPDISTVRTTVPPALAALVMKCLEKAPADRPQSAEALVSALDTIASPSGDLVPTQAAPRTRRRSAIIGAAASVLIAIAAIALFATRGHAKGRIDTIGVMPIDDISGKDSVFVTAMHDLVTNALSRSRQVGVIPRSTMMHYKGTSKTMRDIAKEAQFDAVVEATVFRAGDVMRINVQFTDPITSRSLWSDTYERNVSDVLAAQNEVAEKIAAGVGNALKAPHP